MIQVLGFFKTIVAISASLAFNGKKRLRLMGFRFCYCLHD
jgi:hypothetical protein